jgi:hypothetical protein
LSPIRKSTNASSTVSEPNGSARRSDAFRPQQREVLALAFWGGYSQSEIAARTDTPPEDLPAYALAASSLTSAT